MTAQDHLAALAADPTLRHTGARWRAHEAAYPGMGGAAMADGYGDRDGVLAAECERCAGELRAAGDVEALGYVEWLLAELTPGPEQLAMELAA